MTMQKQEAVQVMEEAIAKLSPALRAVAMRFEIPIFHSACAAGELELVGAFLDLGIAPDMYPCSENEDDEPPLTWIARYRDVASSNGLEVAKLLLDRGAGVDEGLPLLAALEAEDLSMIRLLLATGADPDLVLEEASPQQARFLESVLRSAGI